MNKLHMVWCHGINLSPRGLLDTRRNLHVKVCRYSFNLSNDHGTILVHLYIVTTFQISNLSVKMRFSIIVSLLAAHFLTVIDATNNHRTFWFCTMPLTTCLMVASIPLVAQPFLVPELVLRLEIALANCGMVVESPVINRCRTGRVSRTSLYMASTSKI